MGVDQEQNLSDYDLDKAKKQSLVLDTIAAQCTAESPFEDIRKIAAALKSSGEGGATPKASLQIANLSGGYTNYTYKVYLSYEDGNKNGAAEKSGREVGCTPLFVKLCFPRAFWNPDPDYIYDTRRIANEKEMMEKFGELAPGCVAVPYLLVDIGDMKLLATQWAPADEQMANQFIDGVADDRVAKNLAVSIACLHCSKLDKDFNTEARECMIDIFPSMKDKLMNMATSKNEANNRAVALAKEFGPALCAIIFDNAEKSYRSQEVPTHTDLHAFNCLVEEKPNVFELNTFGENGSVFVCDWEMAMQGPLGLDTGRVFSIPTACIIVHSTNGNGDVVDGLMSWMKVYWETYSEAMVTSGGKDEVFLTKSYRNAMAWLGWKLYAITLFGWFIPFLGIEEGSIDSFKESLGVIALQLMRLGFGGFEPELSLEQLRSVFSRTIADEVHEINSSKRGVRSRRRKSSVLREKNRRVSDAFQGLANQCILEDIVGDN